MAKVRVVLAEVEGTDEAVQSVVSQFVDQVKAEWTPTHRLAFGDPAPELPAIAPPPAAPPAPAEAPTPPRHSSHSAKVKATTNAEFRRKSKAALAAANSEGTRAKVIALLEKGPMPMTSGELIKATGLPNSTIYSMLNILREEGKVVSKPDPNGLYPKQHLVK